MNNVKINDLFEEHRVQHSFKSTVSFILYSPIGLLLMVFRLFIGLNVFVICTILPKSLSIRPYILRIPFAILGMIVVHESGTRDGDCKVVISNFLSAVDHFVISLLWNNVTPCIWDVPIMLSWVLGYSNFGASKGKKSLVKGVKKYIKDSGAMSILVFPEGASTSGKIGLLKFASWPWNLEENVQGITLEIYRPIGITASVLGGRWWADILYTLFSPFTIWKINILPRLSRNGDESDEEISNRYQRQMAESLKLIPTTYTSADKVELAKNRSFTKHGGSQHANRIDEMVKQVLAVLPHVNPEDIKKQLLLHENVETTIANLVENPLFGRTMSDENLSILNNDKTTKVIHQSSKETPKLSLKERQDLFLRDARRRFIEKNS